MKSLMSLWREVANEMAAWCCTSAVRDYKTVTDRVEVEGESFLTITLPQYCKDFERSLELGSIAPGLFSGFQKSGGFPLFLGGFLAQIFDTDGSLLDDPSIDCIRSVRQLTLMFGKIERPTSKRREARAMRKFVETEAELERMDSSGFEEFLPLFRKASTFLWADVFSNVENTILGTHQLARDWSASERFSPVGGEHSGSERTERDWLFQALFPRVSVGNRRVWEKDSDCEIVNPSRALGLVPKHGPGATADKLRGNAKYSVSQWPQRLESVFPYGDYALPSWRYHDQLDRVEFLEPGSEIPVKVISVPKTPKTPRIIAIEPTAMQYAQQALSHQLIDEIEKHVESPPTGGDEMCNLGRFFVGFEHQDPNRVLARQGSLTGRLATLDLSEASDRVLNQHVVLLFERFPHLSEVVQATRSTKADVLGQGVIPLVKFASMGSALCFPVEAMVFTTIVFAAIAYERREPLTRRLFFEMVGKVRVYGDDIIVPVEYVRRVIQFLEAFGLIVNMDKSFWNGKFRESCGGDYYDGEWVTPIRLRHDLPRSLADVSEVVGLVAFRNLLYWGGFWATTAKLDERLNTLLKGNWSIVDATAAGLGRHSALPYKATGMHPTLHTPTVKGASVRMRTPESPITGVGALTKFLIKRGITPSQDPNHLERQGRSEVVGIKLRGIRPY